MKRFLDIQIEDCKVYTFTSKNFWWMYWAITDFKENTSRAIKLSCFYSAISTIFVPRYEVLPVTIVKWMHSKLQRHFCYINIMNFFCSSALLAVTLQYAYYTPNGLWIRPALEVYNILTVGEAREFIPGSVDIYCVVCNSWNFSQRYKHVRNYNTCSSWKVSWYRDFWNLWRQFHRYPNFLFHEEHFKSALPHNGHMCRWKDFTNPLHRWLITTIIFLLITQSRGLPGHASSQMRLMATLNSFWKLDNIDTDLGRRGEVFIFLALNAS